MGRVGAAQFQRRIGILGDLHTESIALEKCLARLHRLNAELLLCVGDVVDGPEEAWGADRCCELLQRHQVLTVCGNHDRWLLEGTQRDLDDALEEFELRPESVEYLRNLPPIRRIPTARGELLLCHGLGVNDMATLSPISLPKSDPDTGALLQEVLEGGYRFVVGGHSHHRLVRTVDGTLFINAGTLHRDYTPVCVLLDLEAQEVLFYSATGEREEPLERVSWDSLVTTDTP